MPENTTNCQEYIEMLSAYIDGELSPADQAALSQHLAICPHCAQELQELQIISQAMKNLPDVPLPENFQNQLHEKLIAATAETTIPAIKKRFWQKSWFPRVAAACIILGVGLTVGSIYQQDLQSQQNGLVVASLDNQEGAVPNSPENLEQGYSIAPLEDDNSTNPVAINTPQPANTTSGKPETSGSDKIGTATKDNQEATNNNSKIATRSLEPDNNQPIAITSGHNATEKSCTNQQQDTHLHIKTDNPLAAKSQVLDIISSLDIDVKDNSDGTDSSYPYLTFEIPKDKYQEVSDSIQAIFSLETIASPEEDMKNWKILIEFTN